MNYPLSSVAVVEVVQDTRLRPTPYLVIREENTYLGGRPFGEGFSRAIERAGFLNSDSAELERFYADCCPINELPLLVDLLPSTLFFPEVP